MGFRQRLANVLTAASRETGTLGDVSDRSNVKAYLADPVSADFKVYAYVYKIPFANFYAHSEQAFNKDSLWQAIEAAEGGGSIDQPSKWGITTSAGEIALWIDDQ